MRVIVIQAVLNLCFSYLYAGYCLYRKTGDPLDSCAMRRSSPMGFFFFLLFLWPLYIIAPFPLHIPEARKAAFRRMISFVIPVILSAASSTLAFLFCLANDMERNISIVIDVLILIFAYRIFLHLFHAK